MIESAVFLYYADRVGRKLWKTDKLYQYVSGRSMGRDTNTDVHIWGQTWLPAKKLLRLFITLVILLIER